MTKQRIIELCEILRQEINVKKMAFVICGSEKGDIELVVDDDAYVTVGDKRIEISEKGLEVIITHAWDGMAEGLKK